MHTGRFSLWREKGRMRVGRKQLTPTAIKPLTSLLSRRYGEAGTCRRLNNEEALPNLKEH